MKAITLATRSQVAGTTFSKPKLVAPQAVNRYERRAFSRG
jgi:hypothetical protein